MSGHKKEMVKQDFPETFILTGKDPQEHLNRTWTIHRSDDISQIPSAITDLSDQGERIQIYLKFLDHQISSSPKINDFSTELLELSFSFREDISVNSLFWTPDPQAICGEIRVINQSEKDKKISLYLIPKIDNPKSGSGITNLFYQGKNLLKGAAGRNTLLCFMSGSPSFDPGSETNLVNDFFLGAGSRKDFRWSVIIDDSFAEGMKRLDELVDQSWKKEISQRKIKLQDRVMITTPDPDWNFVLAYSQYQAGSILHSLACQENDPDNQLIHSLDGKLLFNALYPLDTNDAQKILKITRNQTNVSVENLHPPYPVQGELIWQLSEFFGHDLELGSDIKMVESHLRTWFNKWDSDRDGVPELPSPGYFDRFSSKDNQHNTHIERNPYLESPALCSLLVNEIRRITDLREKYDLKPIDPQLLEYQAKMVEHIKSSWDNRSGSFQTRDSESHLVTKQSMVSEDISPGFNIIREVLPMPSRIGISISAHQSPSINKNFSLVIHGRGTDGSSQIEHLSGSDIFWRGSSIWTFSRMIYRVIDYLFIQGIEDVIGSVYCPGSTMDDISSFFPLLAKLPDDSQLAALNEKHTTKTGKYWSEYGIRTSPQDQGKLVQLPWNILLLEAFLEYKELELANRLFSRLMKGMIEQIRSSGYLYPCIDSNTGKGYGAAFSTAGLIPVRLLLKLAGLEFSNNTLIGTGEYSLDFPLTIQFHGTTITRTGEDTVISIPGEKLRRFEGNQEFEIEFH